MNQCLFKGNLVFDPELNNIKIDENKTTSVVNFRLAIPRRFRKGNGEVGKQITYLDFEAWDSGAEVIARNYKRGDAIIVRCCAKNDIFPDENGKKVSKVKFRVEEFEPASYYREDDGEQKTKNFMGGRIHWT